MPIDSQYDREEEYLLERYNAGEITLEQYNRDMREIQRSYREAAEEAAQSAYEREMDNWR